MLRQYDPEMLAGLYHVIRGAATQMSSVNRPSAGLPGEEDPPSPFDPTEPDQQPISSLMASTCARERQTFSHGMPSPSASARE
jgi:hypothetical protein